MLCNNGIDTNKLLTQLIKPVRILDAKPVFLCLVHFVSTLPGWFRCVIGIFSIILSFTSKSIFLKLMQYSYPVKHVIIPVSLCLRFCQSVSVCLSLCDFLFVCPSASKYLNALVSCTSVKCFCPSDTNRKIAKRWQASDIDLSFCLEK